MTRRGFTLVEVLVGTVVTAVTIAIVARTYQVLSAAVTSLEQRRRESTSRFNAERWLSEALASGDVGIDTAVPFEGQPDRLQMSTTILGPGGWPERTTLTLKVEGGAFRAITRLGQVTIADGIAGVRFDYLVEPGLEAQWVERWESIVSMPLGIRVRTFHRASNVDHMDATAVSDVDTLFILIGGRG